LCGIQFDLDIWKAKNNLKNKMFDTKEVFVTIQINTLNWTKESMEGKIYYILIGA